MKDDGSSVEDKSTYKEKFVKRILTIFFRAFVSRFFLRLVFSRLNLVKLLKEKELL